MLGEIGVQIFFAKSSDISKYKQQQRDSKNKQLTCSMSRYKYE